MDKTIKKITILFDLDGTLIDSTKAILLSFHDTFNHFGDKIPTDSDIKTLIGHPLDFMFEHLGIDKTNVWDYVDIYKKHYRLRSKPMTKLLPYAKEAIIEASTFAKLGIVTTKTGRYSKELLEHMDLMKYFEVLIGREDVTYPKPHPEPILKALHKMNSPKEYSWMIGDTCLDIVSAKKANIQAVAVTCGYGSKNELTKCSKNLQKNSLKAVNYINKLS